ncbi:MAG: DNA repair protein RecN [Roseovarius sp.]|nr:DNA repair protein RecN [Roseovarius sp.]
MLTHLHIRNFALVESLDLDLHAGMSVLSGETGAGKSILLDALGLTLGDRADSNVVRHGADKAEISASFQTDGLKGVQDWLREHELAMEEACILRRIVSSDGRSKAFINGQPMPLQSLRELGEQLVDIHGQHAHQSLLKREVQRDLLDNYAGHHSLLATLAQAWRQWQTLQHDYQALSQQASARDTRLDLLRFQCQELQALQLQPNELQELDEEHRVLANASRLLEGSQQAVVLLYENDEQNINSLLQRCIHELRELKDYDPRLASSADLLESAAIQAGEAASELRHYVDSLELDPQRLIWVEQRLDAIHVLARKHRVEVSELIPLQQALETELIELEQADSRLAGMEKAITQALAEYQQLADQLSASRAKAATRLAKAVSQQIHALGMGGGKLELSLKPSDKGPSIHGNEQVELLVSANPGQPPKPLNKVASGGELSRISLAIQVITASQEGVPTLIFDEVDVGVGGGIAEMVGKLLRALGESRQVLCVTHQPQVAAHGHQHYRISKHSNKDSTYTGVQQVEGEVRVEEVARMSGGLNITEQTLEHARELLRNGGS